MISRRTWNFRANLAAYVLAGAVVAFIIHFIVLSSPKFDWIFPSTPAAATTQVNPAPGAK